MNGEFATRLPTNKIPPIERIQKFRVSFHTASVIESATQPQTR